LRSQFDKVVENVVGTLVDAYVGFPLKPSTRCFGGGGSIELGIVDASAVLAGSEKTWRDAAGNEAAAFVSTDEERAAALNEGSTASEVNFEPGIHSGSVGITRVDKKENCAACESDNKG
jgi:hypothetical protein